MGSPWRSTARPQGPQLARLAMSAARPLWTCGRAREKRNSSESAQGDGGDGTPEDPFSWKQTLSSTEQRAPGVGMIVNGRDAVGVTMRLVWRPTGAPAVDFVILPETRRYIVASCAAVGAWGGKIMKSARYAFGVARVESARADSQGDKRRFLHRRGEAAPGHMQTERLFEMRLV